MIQTEWIEQGKQIGTEAYFDTDNHELLSSIAIQKHKHLYIVFESNLDLSKSWVELEDDERNFTYTAFENSEDVFRYIDSTPFELKNFKPFKGQKIFEPLSYEER